MKFKVLLIIVFISVYNYEVSSNTNHRPFDSFIPWDYIRPLEVERHGELEEIANWIKHNSNNKNAVLTKYDAIRYFSHRPLLGGNDWPQKLDSLKEWYKYRVIYDDFLKEMEIKDLSLFRSKKISYIVINIEDVNVEHVTKLNLAYKTRNFLVYKI